MKKFILISSFLLLFINCHGQAVVHKLISYSNEDYTNNKKLVSDYKAYLENKYKTTDIGVNLKQEYIDDLVSNYEAELGWACNYQNWGEATAYLNQVIKKVLGFRWTPSVEAVIRRNEDNNAFMIEDGKIYINVGMLAAATSEADLASTICHEWGHYTRQHYYESFLKRKDLEATKDKNANSKFQKFRVKQEEDADESALDIMRTTKYSMYALADAYKIILEDEKKLKGEKDYKNYTFSKDHPPTTSRLASALEQAKQADTTGRKLYLVDEAAFLKLKKQAIDECVFLNLSHFNFKENMELCYKQLLQNPDDEFYLFFLNESIRRHLVAFPEETNSYFITSSYNLNSTYVNKSNLPKVNLSRSHPNLKSSSDLKELIFYQYQTLLFADNKKEIAKLPQSYLTNTDTIKFTSYGEALGFFITRQEQLGQSSVNFIKKCLDTNYSFSKISSIQTDLNTYNSIFDSNSTKTNENIYTIIPLNIHYVNDPMSMWNFNVNEHSLYTDILNGLHKINSIPYEVYDYRKISISDKIVLYSFLSGLKKCGLNTEDIKQYHSHKKNDRLDTYKHQNIEVTLLNPEIIPVLARLHLHKLLFTEVWFGESHGGVSYGGFKIVSNSKIVLMSNYFVDLEKKQFANEYMLKKSARFVFTKEHFSVDELANQIYTAAQMLVDDVNRNRVDGYQEAEYK